MKKLLLFYFILFSFILVAQEKQNNTADFFIQINQKSLNKNSFEQIIKNYNATIAQGILLTDEQFENLSQKALLVSGTDQSVQELKNTFKISIPLNSENNSKEFQEKLLSISGVKYCEAIKTTPIPPPSDIAPTTPDYFGLQGYIQSNPGVNMQYAWNLGFNGSGISLYDVEYGMNVNHEEFNSVNIAIASGMTVEPSLTQSYTEHGTGVLGIVYADHGTYGVSGMAHGLDNVVLYPEYTVENGYNRVYAVTQAIANASIGDVIMFEMQTSGAGSGYNYVLAEYDTPIWNLTKAATDAGIVIVAAAGNGNQNLDAAGYANYMALGDSGAIVVGAGTANTTHSRIYYSTYGSRVNLQAWGENVLTTGYDSDYAPYNYSMIGGDFNQSYKTFNGTSSATPIVASCAAVLQSYYHFYTGNYLTSQQIRTILINSGIPQGGSTSAHIGPIPNMQAAFTYLDSTLHSETFASNSLTVYPNPATDFITIEDLKGDFNNGQIAIFNFLGQLVYQNKLTTQTLKINLSDLQNGAYFIKMTNQEKTFLTKIIKK